jgi:peptidoglycan/LPS O-acetylase OafA/YrhL
LGNEGCRKVLASKVEDRRVRLADMDFKNNSIGFLRLLFATLVIYAHAFGLGAFYDQRELLVWLSGNSWSFGTLAVCGFFFLSGFLVTRSYEGLRSLPRFLWHRIVRIFPGYWACLGITVVLIAPFLYHAEHGTLAGYWAGSPDESPMGYLLRNYSLDVFQFRIDGLLSANPFPRALNGSIWTLGNEFRAYLLVAVFGIFGILSRRRILVAVVFAVLWFASIFVGPTTELLQNHRSALGVFEGTFEFEEMFVYFLAGSVAYLYRERIAVSSIACVIAAIGILVVLPWHYFRLFMPALVGYVIIWLMCRLPLRSVDRRFDFSYGIYIYAFPVQQLLTYFHYNRFGLYPYLIMSVGLTLPFAAASWWLVEAPAMRMKNARSRIIDACERGVANVESAARAFGELAAVQLRPLQSRLRVLAPKHPFAARRTVLFGVAACCGAVMLITVGIARERVRVSQPPIADEHSGPGAMFWPAGVISGATSGQPSTTYGVYPEDSRENCCWLAKSAGFRVVPAPHARTLVLAFYIPDLAYLRAHPQSIHARVDGHERAKAVDLPPGIHELRVPLGTTVAKPAATLDIVLDMDVAWTPAAIGFGGDRRALSVRLTSASTR